MALMRELAYFPLRTAEVAEQAKDPTPPATSSLSNYSFSFDPASVSATRWRRSRRFGKLLGILAYWIQHMYNQIAQK